MKVYNTLTRRKEELVPLVPGEIRMYVCGITAYDLSHIGHARSALVFDVIRRYLAFRGYRVRFVKNFTDVDDKIIRRALADGVPAREISERYIAEYRADMAALGVLPPDVEPKATEHVPQMIALIERLVAKGLAYAVDGDVYYEIRRFPPYGRLSGKNLEELVAGARVDVDERKRDPRDFALWKAAKPGEPFWESPWGPGRPGWHIECSAMSMEYLGESFDLHGGGEDLIFPHHECEIAQSEGATGVPFVRAWIHNGFVNLGAEKMSKSLGNILTIKELLKRHEPEALRLYLLGTHYRNPVEFGEDRIEEAGRALERLRGLVTETTTVTASAAGGAGADDATAQALADEVQKARQRFEQAMDDDFNTPQALGVIFDLSRSLYTARDTVRRGGLTAEPFVAGVRTLEALARSLGLLETTAPAPGPAPEVAKRIEALVAARDEARRGRQWKRADELRDELKALGVTLEDSQSGTRWKWKST